MMFRALTILLLSCLVGLSAPPPLLRNSWTTNTAGTPVRGVNNLSVTNATAGTPGTNWSFFGILPSTIARLIDITNSFDFLGDASLTNSTKIGLSAGRVSSAFGSTNLVKTLSAGNAIVLTNDIGGTNVMIAVDQTAPIMGSMTNLPLVMNGINLIFDEEFLGVGNIAAEVGRESWIIGLNGGGAVVNTGIGGDWEPGLIQMIVTNVADRIAFLNDGNSARSFKAITNMEIYCLAKVRIGSTNTATDQNGFYVGIFGSGSTVEPTDGIYWRLTNNIWEVSCASISARSSSFTLSNCVPMQWYLLGFHLDSTGTNANFYMGTDPSSMVFQTNLTGPFPNNTSETPAFYSRKLVGATTRMTNWMDYMKIWVRRLR